MLLISLDQSIGDPVSRLTVLCVMGAGRMVTHIDAMFCGYKNRYYYFLLVDNRARLTEKSRLSLRGFQVERALGYERLKYMLHVTSFV